jgi:ankyrin repeat protein
MLTMIRTRARLVRVVGLCALTIAAVGILAIALSNFSSTSLGRAVRDGDSARVEALIAAGEDVNAPESLWGAQNLKDRTPVSWAAAGGDPEIIRLLLRAGADPNTRDHFGGTPLHHVFIAERSGRRVECLRALLDAGADLGAVDSTGATPLMVAVTAGEIGEVRMLLEAGADPNIVTVGGSALSDAVFNRRDASIAELLMEFGADPHVVLRSGKSVFELAQTSVSQEMKALLSGSQ